jgi:hypothetical protein
VRRIATARPSWAVWGGLAVAVLFLLVSSSSAFACEPYVVDELSSVGPHPWHAQAVLEVEVSRVDEANAADFINLNPLGYQLMVRRILRGRDIPATFEVVRAKGCDSVKLSMRERLIVAVGQGADLMVPKGTDPGYGADNYNSAWYRLLGGGHISLVRGSAWVAGISRHSTIAALEGATDGLPPTDVAVPERGSLAMGAAVILAALATGGWLGIRLRSRRKLQAVGDGGLSG